MKIERRVPGKMNGMEHTLASCRLTRTEVGTLGTVVRSVESLKTNQLLANLIFIHGLRSKVFSGL